MSETDPRDTDVANAIKIYVAKGAPPERRERITTVARDCVRRVGFDNKGSAQSGLNILAAYAGWCLDSGLNLEPAEMFREATIERFAATSTDGTAKARRHDEACCAASHAQINESHGI